MIIKGLFELVYSFLNIILTPFQIIPNMPGTITFWLDIFKSFILKPFEILLFFIHPSIIKVSIPLFLVIINMEHIYTGLMWVLRKLPFLGIE